MTKPRSETAEETAVREAEGEVARCRARLEALVDERTEAEARVRAYHEQGRPSAALAERDHLRALADELAVAEAQAFEAGIELLTAKLPALERAARETAEEAFAYRHGEAERVARELIRLDCVYQDAKARLDEVRAKLPKVNRAVRP